MSAILSGQIGAMSLFDICQFLMLNRRSGELVVEKGGKRTFLFFDEGQIVNAVDDGLNDGEPAALRVLLLTEGTFEFREGGSAPSRRIEVSTENLLLDVARQVDELAERTGAARTGPGRISAELSQAALFELKQRQARELEELFRSVAGGTGNDAGGDSTGRFEDALRAIRGSGAALCYREERGGAVLVAASFAAVSGGAPAARIALPAKSVRGFLRRTFAPAARRALAAGEGVAARFTGEGATYHLRAWKKDGALAIDAHELLAPAPEPGPSEFFDDLLREAAAHESGVLFLCVPPRGGATSLVAAIIERLLPGGERYLLIEERPRYLLACDAGVLDRRDAWDLPEGILAAAARTRPALVLMDAVRDSVRLRSVIEAARAGFPVLAVVPGAGSASAVRSLLSGVNERERPWMAAGLAETARLFFGAVPVPGSSPRAFAHEKIGCTLEVQGLLGSGDLAGFETLCAESGRTDVRPFAESVASLRQTGAPADWRPVRLA